MIKAGTLTEEILIERKTQTLPNSTSMSTTYSWAALMTSRASVKIMTGEEQIKSGKQEASNRIKVVMRNRRDIAVKIGDRVTWENRTWLIDTAPVIDSRKTKLEFIALDEFI